MGGRGRDTIRGEEQHNRTQRFFERLQKRGSWRRKIWAFGGVALLVGLGFVLFSILSRQTGCTALLELGALLLSVALGVAVALVIAGAASSDDLVWVACSILSLIVISGGATLALPPLVRHTFLADLAEYWLCPEPRCQSAPQALDLLARGHFAAAEDVARACLSQLGAGGEQTAQCEKECGCALVEAQIAQAKDMLSRGECVGVGSWLEEARATSRKYGCRQDYALDTLEMLQQQVCRPAPTAVITVAPTPTTSPTAAPAATQVPTKPATPAPTLTPMPTVPAMCRSVLRLSEFRHAGTVTLLTPRADIHIPRTGGPIEIWGAAYMKDRVEYELTCMPIDEQGLPRQATWMVIGSRRPAPVGDDISNGFLTTWSEGERTALAPGRYALFLRMIAKDGNYTTERDYEPCWVFVVLE